MLFFFRDRLHFDFVLDRTVSNYELPFYKHQFFMQIYAILIGVTCVVDRRGADRVNL